MSPLPLTPAIAFVAFTFFSASNEPVSPLKGEYREINVTKETEAIQTFLNGTDKEKERMAMKLQAIPHQFAPVVFYHLSVYLHQQGEADEATSWLYRARIRTYFDIQRCTDPSVGDAGEVLNRLIPQLLKLEQFADLKKSKQLMLDAMTWDRETTYGYDPRWIALHGIRASLPEPAPGYVQPLLIPEDQWESLAERNRMEYLRQWLTDTSSITAEQMEQIQANYDELRAAEENSVTVVEDASLEIEVTEEDDESSNDEESFEEDEMDSDVETSDEYDEEDMDDESEEDSEDDDEDDLSWDE